MKTFWFTQKEDDEPVDLTTVSEYAGRVEDHCENNICTLRIRNLRESDSAEYWFRFETNQDPPKRPSVSVSPSAEIEEGRSVTLTCSSDANPAAKYNWYKKNRKEYLPFFKKGPQFVFSSIKSSDSGQYYCTAENNLGMKTSKGIFIHVKHAPKLPSVSVSPSAEIEEGSSVTLTCSSDANPAANYTWYKKVPNAHLSSVNEGPRLVFSSIQSSDSGEYYCTAENELGRRTSKNISIDVKYPPKIPSVSVSPSAEIEEGSSVTLTCSSDANPAANYTWYKEDEDSPKASGQIFSITDFRAEHSGSYSCGALNKLGRLNSTIRLTITPGRRKLIGPPRKQITLCTVCRLITLASRKGLKNTRAVTDYYLDSDSMMKDGEPVDLKTDSEYAGRVEDLCENRICTLRIRNLTESDSAEYWFRFETIQDAPKLPSVSVSPSAEIEEGSSVTLTCSSDANPAANYTWYMKNVLIYSSEEHQIVFSSMQASDSGEYFCSAENELGRRTSEKLFIDVKCE
ncbi:hypothetical protein NQZ68_013485 [Dissostichus eleginoides]|nr:hypothetical protein NQZ68_013485 [Dissostichus eleginoides]